MLFWVLAALMTVAVAIILLLPLARRSGDDHSVDHDVEVYRDQLREIDRDVSGDLISGEEAEFARAEVGRRLIKAARRTERRAAGSARAASLARAAVIISLPLISVGAYLATGNPDLPAQPLAERQSPQAQGQDLRAMVSQVETHLANNPEDGQGWDVLAPIYMRMNRLAQAETAYRNAIRLLGSTAARQAGLGQVLFSRAGGIVTAESQAAFQAVLETEPGNPYASYFLALALAQEGRREQAYEAFATIARVSPADAPWMQAVRDQMQRLRGPDAEDVEAAMEMTAEDRRDMIKGMVAGLDARLREQSDDLDGWLRLIRSYMVLGESEQATSAFERAIDAFPEDSPQRRTLVDLAAALGLETTETTQ